MEQRLNLMIPKSANPISNIVWVVCECVCTCVCVCEIVGVRVTYIRKLAILGNRGPWLQPVTAQCCVLIFGDPLTLIPDKPLCKYWSAYL